MGKLTITLDDSVEKKFRDAVYKSKGMKRGNIDKCAKEAINDWIAKIGKGV